MERRVIEEEKVDKKSECIQEMGISQYQNVVLLYRRKKI